MQVIRFKAADRAGLFAALATAGLVATDPGGGVIQRPRRFTLFVRGALTRPAAYDADGIEVAAAVTLTGHHADLIWKAPGDPPAALAAITIPEPAQPLYAIRGAT